MRILIQESHETDFVWTVMDHEKHKTISAGNCFYPIGAGENSTESAEIVLPAVSIPINFPAQSFIAASVWVDEYGYL